ncbi:MAG: glycosyl hydrolase 2 galactose-binding domain-containing protein [Spirochaetota bacterium]
MREIVVLGAGNIGRGLLGEIAAREGLMGNPFPPDDYHATREWERVDDWVYETVFDAPAVGAGAPGTGAGPRPRDEIDLLFEGIDTIADVWLNDELVLHAENMLVPHAVSVTERLRPRANTLRVRIYSAELHARRYRYDAFQYSRGQFASRQAQAYLRKARHMWGWDNAPHLVSAGIWRPVNLVVRPGIRIDEVYLNTQVIRDDAIILGCSWSIGTPDVDLSSYRGVFRLRERGEGRATSSSARGGRVVHQIEFPVTFVAGRFTTKIDPADVKLWWPRGYGEPVLYDAEIELYVGDEVASRWVTRFGIRTIELLRSDVTTKKADGEFVFRCNGERIYINGANWKPKHALHSLAEARVRPALDLALDLNCNMIRVWGGGIYEGHAFYDYCDEHGVLVWQDFMFACEFPPNDEWFIEAVKREAEWVVREFRNHPSIGVWSGDNEVDQMFFKKGRMAHDLRPSHNLVNRKVLPEAVRAWNPHTPYLESSPYASDRIIDERLRFPDGPWTLYPPEDHVYPGALDFASAYRASPSHFVSETGPFFINAMSESESIVDLEMPRAKRLWDVPFDRRTASVDMSLDGHQTDLHFLSWKQAVQERMEWLFGREFSLSDWRELALAVNVYSGDCFKFAIEYSRSRKWKKTGVIWWSLSDMFPMMFNYSVVDYEWKPKKPYYWIRQSQLPQCLMMVEADAAVSAGRATDGRGPAPGRFELFAVNDTRREFSGEYRITAVDAHGNESEHATGRFECPPNESVMIGEIDRPAEPSMLLVSWPGAPVPGYDGDGAGRPAAKELVNHFVSGERPFEFEAYRRWVGMLDGLYEVERR